MCTLTHAHYDLSKSLLNVSLNIRNKDSDYRLLILIFNFVNLRDK